MKQIINLLCLGFLVAGCSAAPITVSPVIPTQSLAIPTLPDQVQPQPVQVIVLNKDQLQQLLTNLQKNPDPNFVLFALDSTNYNNLITNVTQLDQWILDEKDVVKTYVLYLSGQNAPVPKSP